MKSYMTEMDFASKVLFYRHFVRCTVERKGGMLHRSLGQLEMHDTHFVVEKRLLTLRYVFW